MTTALAQAVPPPSVPAAAEGATGAEPGGDFALVTVGAGRYAISLSELSAVIGRPSMARVPLAPPELLGFANLRGKVLPVADLSAILGARPRRDPAPAHVLVCNAGGPAGLVVDTMTGIQRIATGGIEPAARIGAGLDGDTVTGIFSHQGDLYMVLSVKALLERTFGALRDRSAAPVAAVAPRRALRETPDREQAERGAERLLLTFAIGGEAFALPVAEAAEILPLPERQSPLPGAGPHVPAVVEIRGRLIALVDLRPALGLSEPGHPAQVVVLGRIGAPGSSSLGIMADRVEEVLTAPESAITALPAGAPGSADTGLVPSVCQFERGARMIGILDPARIAEIAGPAEIRMPAVCADEPGEEEPMRAEDDAGADGEAGAQVLIFELAGESYGIDIAAVREIIPLPARVTRLPHAPDHVRGVVNLRGSILPVIDTRRRFGLAPDPQRIGAQVLVLSAGGPQTGFLVDSVTEVAAIPPGAVRAAPRFDDDVIEIVTEVATLPGTDRMILLLDAAGMTGSAAAAAAMPER